MKYFTAGVKLKVTDLVVFKIPALYEPVDVYAT